MVAQLRVCFLKSSRTYTVSSYQTKFAGTNFSRERLIVQQTIGHLGMFC